MRTVADVTFLEIVTFRLKQRLTFQGAFDDYTLPAPAFSDDKEVIVEEVGEDDVHEGDGLKGGKRSSLQEDEDR